MRSLGDGMYGSKHFSGKLSRPPPGHMSEARVEALNKKQQKKEFVRRTLKKYDVSKSGGLLWDELKTFVQDLDTTRPEPTEVLLDVVCSARSTRWQFAALDTELGPAPLPHCHFLSQEELKWLIQMSTHDHQVFAGVCSSWHHCGQR